MKQRKLLLLSLISLTLCSCNNVSGQWKSTTIAERSILTSSNVMTSPFNTYMSMYYFISEENDDTFANIENIFSSSIIDSHKKFDRHYSYYDDNQNLVNNIKTINDSYGTGLPIKCSDELYELLKISCHAFELTDGMFNIFTGGLSDYWEYVLSNVYDFGDESFINLDPYKNNIAKENLEKLVNVIPKTLNDFNKQLTFNDQTKEITFNKIESLDSIDDDYVLIDNVLKIKIRPIISVGGVAKGYATDIVKNKLKENNYLNCYISSGGSSITTLSKPIFESSDGGHKISVLNPKKSTLVSKEVAFSLKFANEFSFSTSGNYTTGKSYHFKDDDGNYIYRHHIINPFSGYPENYYCSVSITSSSFSNAYLDCFSTAFMNLNIEDGMKLKKKILESFEGYDLDLFYLDNDEQNLKLYATSNVNKTLKVGNGVEVIYEK